MKINELITSFVIATSNEEAALLDSMPGTQNISYYTEREQQVIENLIRKSLVTKVIHNNETLVTRNDL